MITDCMNSCFFRGPWGDGSNEGRGSSPEERGGQGGYRGEHGSHGGGHGGGPGGRGGNGHGGGPGDLLRGKLQGRNDAQILFVGSVNCLRHKPYMGISELMKEEKASILCPSMSDFSSGRYLTQIEEAIVELSEERNCNDFVLICGCQWVILSTDGELIKEHLKNNHGIDLTISVDDHLEFGDHE